MTPRIKVPSYTLAAPLSEQDWRARAACHGLNPLMWDEIGEPDQRAEGILICNTLCPVSRECLAEGIEAGAEGTVRGGVLIGVAANTCGYCGDLFTEQRGDVLRPGLPQRRTAAAGAPATGAGGEAEPLHGVLHPAGG